MIKPFIFLFGFGLSIIGFIYIITYLNYLSIGYSLINYFSFILSRFECLLAPFGLFLILFSIFSKGDKNVLCI